ncbi:unnamed protein product, partial [Polarella glacialis]
MAKQWCLWLPASLCLLPVGQLFLGLHRPCGASRGLRTNLRRFATTEAELRGEPATVGGYAEALQVLAAAQQEDAAEARSVFRRLARVMHPDVAGDSPETRERFQGLLEAYQVVVKGEGKKALKDALQRGDVPSWAQGEESKSRSPKKSVFLEGTERFD